MKTSSWLNIAAAASIALGSALANAGEYTLLIYESSEDLALRSKQSRESADYWSEYKAFGQEMADARIMRGGAPLDVPATANAVGKIAVRSDARGFPGLSLGGYFQIEVATLEDALRWAKKAPAVHRGGAVEVRSVVATPGM